MLRVPEIWQITAICAKHEGLPIVSVKCRCFVSALIIEISVPSQSYKVGILAFARVYVLFLLISPACLLTCTVIYCCSSRQ